MRLGDRGAGTSRSIARARAPMRVAATRQAVADGRCATFALAAAQNGRGN